MRQARKHNLPPPSIPPGCRFQIIGPKPGYIIEAVALQEQIIGCYTHWAGRTQPCTCDLDCQYCKGGLAKIWKGYLPSISSSMIQRQILELSHHAGLALLKYQQSGQTIRGRRIRLQRKTPKKNAEVLVEVGELQILPADLPATFDVVPTLLRLWQIPKWIEATREQKYNSQSEKEA